MKLQNENYSWLIIHTLVKTWQKSVYSELFFSTVLQRDYCEKVDCVNDISDIVSSKLDNNNDIQESTWDKILNPSENINNTANSIRKFNNYNSDKVMMKLLRNKKYNM